MPNLILVHQNNKRNRADCEAMERRIAAGVPGVAELVVDTKETGWFEPRFDPAERGPYLVVKPELGRKGAEIFITG